jgi:hypothetical protein
MESVSSLRYKTCDLRIRWTTRFLDERIWVTKVGKTVPSIDTSIRRDAVWLAIVPIVAALLPLLMSSTFWTYHDERNTISMITWEILAVSQLIVIVLFAMWQPTVRSLPFRCLDVAALLVVVVVFPLVRQTLIRFWVIRPDSWDVLIWRLEDDWSRGSFLHRLRQSVCLLIVALLLWAWGLVSEQRLTHTGQVPSVRSKKMSIQSLMMTTTLVAALASALLKLEWAPGVQDLRELLKAIPISSLVSAYRARTSKPWSFGEM